MIVKIHIRKKKGKERDQNKPSSNDIMLVLSVSVNLEIRGSILQPYYYREYLCWFGIKMVSSL